MKIIEKHTPFLRILHWLNVPLLALMVWSGVLIYWANDIYPFFFPRWFYDFFSVEGRLAEGMAIHFFVGWLFVTNGLIYGIWFFVSGHWREILPNRSTFKEAWPTFLFDLGLRKELPSHDKFNALQKLTYTMVLVVAVLVVLTGLAIYKPVQLNALLKLMGGYQTARAIHFGAMIFFCLFTVVHIIQVLRAGWNNFRAMVAGFEIEK